jgi:hypothetical protein
MKVSRAFVAMLAAGLLVALCAAPSAVAASGADSASAKSAQAKVSTRALNRRLNTTRRQVASARRTLSRLSRDLGALGGRVKNTEGGLGAILAQAPAILEGLTALRDRVAPGLAQLATVVRDTIAPGLTKLSDAVQKEIVPGLKAAGEGLVALKGAVENQIAPRFSAIEYGFGQVIIVTNPGPPPVTQPQGGSFVVTPDISDAVQQAQTTQQFIAQHSGLLAVAYGIRSGESDGTGADNPAGHCKVTVTNEGQTTATTEANPAFGGLPFQPVPEKSALTSTDPANQTFPFGLKTAGADADKFTTFLSNVQVAQGDTYTVGLSCLDTTASATDPRA